MASEEDGGFEGWWRAIEPKVRRLGRALLRSGEAAQDLSQEVAVAALMKYPDFRNGEHFAGWVMTRARWLALDRLRMERHAWPLEAVPASQDAPAAEDDGALRDIFRAISRLPERQQVVTLRTIEGYSAAEIGRELGIAEATVRSLLRHARLKLAAFEN
jgi:RNA polymerase sigma-70 factor (ECF subfamily)